MAAQVKDERKSGAVLDRKDECDVCFCLQLESLKHSDRPHRRSLDCR
jgi:hypothetical protein